METKPIDSVVVQALLRAAGVVEVAKEDKPEEGEWQLGWLSGPLPRTKEALQGPAGRKGLFRALAGSDKPRVRGLLPLDAGMHPEKDEPKRPALGLGTWVAFHPDVPIDLVLDPTDSALGLGIGVRVLKAGEPWFVVLVRIAEVAVGDPKVATSEKALARLRKPLSLEGHMVLGKDAFLPRVGLVAQFDPSLPKDFSAELELGDRRGRGTRVRFPKTPAGSFVGPPLAALFAVLRAFVVSKVVDLEKAEAEGAAKNPNAFFRRLEQHLLPLFEGGKDNPIPALSADVLALDQPGAVGAALVAWLRGLLPKTGTTLFDLKFDAAAAVVSHLRALFFGVPDDQAPAVSKGSWCAWVKEEKDFGAVLANAGLVLDYDDTGLATGTDRLSLGLGARVRAKQAQKSDPDVSLDVGVTLYELVGTTMAKVPALTAAFSVRAPEGTTGPAGVTRLEIGVRFDGSFAPYAAVFLGEKTRLLLGRDDAALLAKLKELGQGAATGLWQQASSLVAEFFGASTLATLTQIASVGPRRFLEETVLSQVRTLVGQVATGDLSLSLPGNVTLGLTASGLTLALPSTSPLSGSASISAAGASVSLGFGLSGPEAFPFDVSVLFGLDGTGGSVRVRVAKPGVPESLLPVLGAVTAPPSLASAVGLLWPELQKLLPGDATALLKQVGLVDGSGQLALSTDGKSYAIAGWNLLFGMAKEGLPDKLTGAGGKPELAIVRSETELGLKLTGLTGDSEGISASVEALTLGVARKVGGVWSLTPSLGGKVRVDARGSDDSPLLANDFLYLDRAAVSAEMDIIGLDLGSGAFRPPSLTEARIEVRDLRLPFGGSGDPKKGTSIEQGLLAKDGQNPGLSLDVGWNAAKGELLLDFPKGAPAAPKLPAGDEVAITIPVNRQIGPLDVGGITVGLSGKTTKDPKSASVHVVLDAAFDLAGVRVEPEGLGVRIPFATIASPETWSVTLSGLGLSFKNGGITLAGRFARVGDGFEGDALVSAYGFSLGAIGGYTQIQAEDGSKHPSLYVFAVCKTPLGGPPFFFVTGVAGGFGVNRMLERSEDPRQIRNHPLLALMSDNVTEGRKYLAKLGPRHGAFWLAGGVNFLSFGLIRGSALLYILFDRGFELGVMAVAGVSMEGLAQVQIGIDAGLTTRGETTLWARGALFDSWLVFPDCQLTGGFALQVWPDAGEAVISIGGYGPLYKKPARYPSVELLGLKWQSDALVAKGGVYFAMTPREAMAGVQIEVVGKWGPLSAGFNAEVHGLLGWDPFHFEVLATVGVWGAFGGMRFEVGVGLHLYGPPVGGRATVKLLVVSVSIPFGADKASFPEHIDVPKLLQSLLSLQPATASPSNVVLTQATLWGAAAEKPSALALAIPEGRAGDPKSALPGDPKTPALTGAEPVFSLATRLPFDRVEEQNGAAVPVPTADPLHLGPAGRRVTEAKLEVAMPRAVAYRMLSLTPRNLAYSVRKTAQPKALFGPTEAYAQGQSAASDDTMAEVHTVLEVSARAPEVSPFPDVARGPELSKPGEELDLPLEAKWLSPTQLVGKEKSWADKMKWSAAAGASARPARGELIGARLAPELGASLAYRPLAQKLEHRAAQKALARQRSAPRIPAAVGVAVRSMDRALRGGALTRTHVSDAAGLPRIAPPTASPRSLVVAAVRLRVTAPPPLSPRPTALREGQSELALARQLGSLTGSLVLPAPSGGHRVQALTVGAVFGDGPLRARVAAGEAAFFRVAEPGSLPAAPLALRLRGDMPVRLVTCDASGQPLSDEELWPSGEPVPLAAEATRVALFGLGRPAAAPPRERGHEPVPEVPPTPEAAPVARPEPSLRDLIGERPRIRPFGPRVEPPRVEPAHPATPAHLPTPVRAQPPRVLELAAARGLLRLRPGRKPKPPVVPIVVRERLPERAPGILPLRPIRDALNRPRPAPPPAPPPPPPPPPLPETPVGFGPGTELFVLGKTTLLAPGCSLGLTGALDVRAGELTTVRAAEVLARVDALRVVLPAGRGALVLGVTLPDEPVPRLTSGLRCVVGDRRLLLFAATAVGRELRVVVPWEQATEAALELGTAGGYRLRSLALLPLDVERAARLVAAHPSREWVRGDLLGLEGSVELELEVIS